MQFPTKPPKELQHPIKFFALSAYLLSDSIFPAEGAEKREMKTSKLASRPKKKLSLLKENLALSL